HRAALGRIACARRCCGRAWRAHRDARDAFVAAAGDGARCGALLPQRGHRPPPSRQLPSLLWFADTRAEPPGVEPVSERTLVVVVEPRDDADHIASALRERMGLDGDDIRVLIPEDALGSGGFWRGDG